MRNARMTLAVIGGVLLSLAAPAVANAAEAVPAPADCDVTTILKPEYLGGGVFQASATVDCTITIASYKFVDPAFVPVDTNDFSHDQVLFASRSIVVTPTVQQFTVDIPACGPYQADMYYGPAQAFLRFGGLMPEPVAHLLVIGEVCTDPGTNPTDPTDPTDPGTDPGTTPTDPGTDPGTTPTTPTTPAVTPVPVPTTAPAAVVTPVAVRATPVLAATGVDDATAAWMGGSALALLLAGGLLTVAARRRKA